MAQNVTRILAGVGKWLMGSPLLSAARWFWAVATDQVIDGSIAFRTANPLNGMRVRTRVRAMSCMSGACTAIRAKGHRCGSFQSWRA
jgi:hypothetical protein